MFGSSAAEITVERRHFKFRYRSPEHYAEVLRTYYGPMIKTFTALNDAQRDALWNDLVALIADTNEADDGTLVAPGEYLEVVIVKR